MQCTRGTRQDAERPGMPGPGLAALGRRQSVEARPRLESAESGEDPCDDTSTVESLPTPNDGLTIPAVGSASDASPRLAVLDRVAGVDGGGSASVPLLPLTPGRPPCGELVENGGDQRHDSKEQDKS